MNFVILFILELVQNRILDKFANHEFEFSRDNIQIVHTYGPMV